ncbi:MAG: archaellin/type IV pilin N-terminal domain-containing protein [Candidatus Bathyarchaeia archaeon]
MRKTFKRNRKAVSPVIATIIIVAIAIVMAIAVAYWMLGLGGAFTRYEKLEIPTAYAKNLGGNNFNITMVIKNTGSATATIDLESTLYNGKPPSAYGGYGTGVIWYNATKKQINVNSPELTLEPGKTLNVVIKLANATAAPNAWISGMTVEIMIHTVAGKDYPKVVVLP